MPLYSNERAKLGIVIHPGNNIHVLVWLRIARSFCFSRYCPFSVSPVKSFVDLPAYMEETGRILAGVLAVNKINSWSVHRSLRLSKMPSTLSTSRIHFHFLQGGFHLQERGLLKSFIETLFKKEKKKLSTLSYIFCSDEYLLDINRQYLRHDFYTDIITFGLSDPEEAITAEIYISVDRVRDNAGQFSTSFKREMHRVIFHGALHLCGYRDKKKGEVLLMRKMEDKYLSLYFPNK